MYVYVYICMPRVRIELKTLRCLILIMRLTVAKSWSIALSCSKYHPV